MTERFGFGAQKSKLIRNIIIKLLHQSQGWNFSKDVSLSSSWKGEGTFSWVELWITGRTVKEKYKNRQKALFPLALPLYFSFTFLL